MFITCETELHKSILNISQNIANVASDNSLITKTGCLSDIGWW